jgi:hypothetical protein
MEPTAKDTEKDAARPAHPDTQNKSTEEHGERDRLKRTADQMARRGLKRQHKGEVGKTFPK